jgi:hypothetical protein
MPAAVIARMLMNLALDAGIGSIPLVGDAFDIFHKAHRKNAELYTAQTTRPARSSWKDAFVVVAATLAFLAALALPVYVAVRVIGALT